MIDETTFTAMERSAMALCDRYRAAGLQCGGWGRQGYRAWTYVEIAGTMTTREFFWDACRMDWAALQPKAK